MHDGNDGRDEPRGAPWGRPDANRRQRHTVWIATEFRVEAATRGEAAERAREWLADAVERCPAGDGLELRGTAARLDDAAVLALQLLAMENRGGEAAARVVARLRADIAAAIERVAATPEPLPG